MKIKKLRNFMICIFAFIFLVSNVSAFTIEGTNSTGWNELYNNGSIIQSAFALYNGPNAWNGLFFTILFFVFQGMLFLKTRSSTLCFFTTGLTVAIVWLNPALQFLIKRSSLWIFFVYMVILIAGIIYQLKEGY